MGTTTIGDHAVVLGGSVAGLLAARVLAERYLHVTVVERDLLPAAGGHRRGVPQGRHVHGLLPRGRELIEELFAGFTDELVAAGATTGDELAQGRWLFSGHRLARAASGRTSVFLSRPMLEGHLRARVRAVPTITIADGCDVLGLTSTADRERVTGVHVLDRDPLGTARTLTADLVLDATGRGSRTPVRLEQFGYKPPGQERVEIGVCYASRNFRLRPDALEGDRLILCGGTVEHPHGGALSVQENGRHIVSVAGMLGEPPPTELTAFRTFAASMPFPDIADAIHDAEPIGEPATYRYQANQRHRYERLRRFPAGLMVLGDAVCSFNPIYGQGMTVAALQAHALRALLANGQCPSPAQYFRAIAKVIDPAWEMTTGADLANPGVVGKRTPAVRLANAYIPRLHAAAATDPALAAAFTRVSGLIDRPQALMRPDRLLRVLTATRRRQRNRPADLREVRRSSTGTSSEPSAHAPEAGVR
jgi:2-polyprenyl-6-methoxyphenol hydroxylase-like FAD-dependent oxidoreductase